jgi:hypothetical protein
MPQHMANVKAVELEQGFVYSGRRLSLCRSSFLQQWRVPLCNNEVNAGVE